MEENMQYFGYIMLYYLKKSKRATELQKKKKVCAVYGDGAMTDWGCQKWFAKVCAGDFSLDDDAPRSGRQVEVDSDQIETLTENNQCYNMQEIANTFKISKSTKLLAKMKNVSLFYEKIIQTFWPTQYNTSLSAVFLYKAHFLLKF